MHINGESKSATLSLNDIVQTSNKIDNDLLPALFNFHPLTKSAGKARIPASN